MSFSALWNQAEVVYRHGATRREGLQDLINLLKGRADVELRYSKGLEKLGNHPNYVSDYGTLGHAISALKSNWLNQSLHAKNLSEQILVQVIEPLQRMALGQIPLIKAQTQSCKRILRLIRDKSDRLERTKQRYIKDSMDTEQLALGLEELKHQERKVKAAARLYESKRELDISLETYIAALEDFNANREGLQDELEQLLLSFQVQEGQRLDAIKSALACFNSLELTRASSLKLDLKNLVPAITSIDAMSDISAFTSSKTTTPPPRLTMTFHPYDGTHPLFCSSAFPLLFHQDDWMDYFLASERCLRRPEMDIIMRKVGRGESLEEEDFERFKNILYEDSGVRVWTQCLNRRRFESEFDVNETGFVDLGKLMNIALVVCLELKDNRGIRNIIILSHTFYRRNTNPKEFLQTAIMQHPCWKEVAFWRTLLVDQIEGEFEQFADLCMAEDMVSDTQSRIKNIMFAQLSSFSHIMQAFDFVTTEAGDLLREYAQRYLLPAEELQAILSAFPSHASDSPPSEESAD